MNVFFKAAASDPSGLLTIGMLVLMFVVLYFLIIRPQKKQEKEVSQMRDNLQVGDEVTTIGGIIGEIISIKDETVMIETGKDKTRIRFLRSAIRCVDVPASAKNGYQINLPEKEAEKTDEVTEAAPAEEKTEKKGFFAKKK